jgi:hypothetical protein
MPLMMTTEEYKQAIIDINELVRANLENADGDFPFLDRTNGGCWSDFLEREGYVEIPSFYSASGRPEIVHRKWIGSIGGAA